MLYVFYFDIFYNADLDTHTPIVNKHIITNYNAAKYSA